MSFGRAHNVENSVLIRVTLLSFTFWIGIIILNHILIQPAGKAPLSLEYTKERFATQLDSNMVT